VNAPLRLPLLVLFAVHPALWLGAGIGWSVAWPLDIAAFLLLADRTLPLADPTPREPVHTPRLDGFDATVRPRVADPPWEALAAATLGYFGVGLVRLWSVVREAPGDVALGLACLSVLMGLVLLGLLAVKARVVGDQPTEVVLTGRRLTVGRRTLLLSGTHRAVLQGSRLVVTDGDEAVRIDGQPGELAWLAERLSAIASRGHPADVPRAMATLQQRQP
jgi:hypothetical protein